VCGKARQKQLHAHVIERNEADVALAKARQVTHVQALRLVIRAQNIERGLPVDPIPPDPAKDKLIADADFRLQKAELAIAEGRIALEDHRRELQKARAKTSECRTLWLALHPPVTPRQAFQDHLDAHKRRAENGEDAVAEMARGPASHLDAVMAGGGRGHSVNRGYGRAYSKFRLPSQQ
jgi:hypothetical protein